MVSYAAMDRLCAQAEESLYIRALVGDDADILVLTGLRRPKITGGVSYRARPDQLPQWRYELRPELITPGSGPQRQRNEFSYLEKVWREAVWVGGQVWVLSRDHCDIGSHNLEFLLHLERLQTMLEEQPDILTDVLGRTRHEQLYEPLKQRIADFVVAAYSKAGE